MSSAPRKFPPLSDVPPDPVIEAYKKDVDRSLLRENLKLTAEQRIMNLMALQEFAAELRSGMRAAKCGEPSA